ncbi:SLC7A9 [Cordylochernes scorpioides]|uniref:SLC7A9 n=1 Tax=Cordylochernes scorpioides TaxID=51811 RepID=A0ABY6LXD2_9ARAC|nr:SLC7A9 [Cordylochernes scorpioides]
MASTDDGLFPGGALCYGELGTMITKSGAEYVYLLDAFGPLPAFLFSWVSVLVLKPSMLAIICLTLGEYVVEPLYAGCYPDHMLVKMVTVISICLITLINCYGVQLATEVQNLFTAAKLLAIIIIVIGGLVKILQGQTEHLSSGFEGSKYSFADIATAFYSGLWAYDGWNNLNYVTEEIVDPAKNLPLAITIAIPVVVLCYVAVNISYITAMSSAELLASEAVAVVSTASELVKLSNHTLNSFHPTTWTTKCYSEPSTINAVEILILEDRKISIFTIADNLNIIYRTVHTIIKEQLQFRKICCRWIPHFLNLDQKLNRIRVSKALLKRYEEEGDHFLDQIVTGDESWCYHYDPSTKRASMEWKRGDSPRPKKKNQVSTFGRISNAVPLCAGQTEHLSSGFEGSKYSFADIATAFYSGLWAYDGWNNLNYVTEEIVDPAKNLPLAITIAIPVVVLCYVAVNISYITAMSSAELLASEAVAVRCGDFTMEQILKQRICIEFCVKLQISATETFEMLNKAFPNDTPKRTTVFKWHSRFKAGRISIEDGPRQGGPKFQRTNENLEQDTGISKTTIGRIVTEDLKLKKTPAKFIPRFLTDEQKLCRLATCEDMLEMTRMDPEWKDKITTGDETWVYGYDPETKASICRVERSGPQKSRISKSRNTVLLVAFLDNKGIVHHEYLPAGQTGSDSKNSLEKWTNGDWILHHDNARPHTAHLVTRFLAKNGTEILPQPPYSPDIAPNDFFLFPKLEAVLKGKHFDTRNDIIEKSLLALKIIPKEAYKNCFDNWEKRWRWCVKERGDYFEKF